MKQDEIAKNILSVYQKIEDACKRVGRDPKSVRIVAVSKTFSPDYIKASYDLGIKDFGESYVQEALLKMEKLKNLDITWHFIGRIQSNKIKNIVGNFQYVHSLSSLDHVLEFEKRSGGRSKIKAFLQVNIAKEKTKSGILEEDILTFLEKFWEISTKSLELIGLMVIPPPSPQNSRIYFRRLREIRDNLVKMGYPITELSMGMSDDFEIAIEEGATFVRIGRYIFGERLAKLY